MVSLSRFSLLPLVLLLMATSFACSSALAQARTDGLNGRKILPQTGGVSSSNLAAQVKDADDTSSAEPSSHVTTSNGLSGEDRCLPGMHCIPPSPPPPHRHHHHPSGLGQDDLSGEERCLPGMRCLPPFPPPPHRHHHRPPGLGQKYHHHHGEPATAPTPGDHQHHGEIALNSGLEGHHHHHHYFLNPPPRQPDALRDALTSGLEGHHHHHHYFLNPPPRQPDALTPRLTLDEINGPSRRRHHHHKYPHPPSAPCSALDEINCHHDTPIYHEPPHAQTLDEINHHHHTPIYHEPPHAQMTLDHTNEEAGVVEPNRHRRCRDNPHLCHDLEEIEPDHQAVTRDDLGASVR